VYYRHFCFSYVSLSAVTIQIMRIVC